MPVVVSVPPPGAVAVSVAVDSRSAGMRSECCTKPRGMV